MTPSRNGTRRSQGEKNAMSIPSVAIPRSVPSRIEAGSRPRGANLPGEDDGWGFGTGAGFYLDATAEPWSRHYRMGAYINHELPALVEANFPILAARKGIFANPVAVPWGEKAFGSYLGPDRTAWAAWDASLLMAEKPYPARSWSTRACRTSSSTASSGRNGWRKPRRRQGRN